MKSAKCRRCGHDYIDNVAKLHGPAASQILHAHVVQWNYPLLYQPMKQCVTNPYVDKIKGSDRRAETESHQKMFWVSLLVH